MDFLPAVLIGIVCGALGFTPFLVARRQMKARLKSDGLGSIAVGMVAVFVSFVVMAVEIVLCAVCARAYILPFSISVIVVFLLAMIVYTTLLMRK